MWQCPRCERPLRSVRSPKGPHHLCERCDGEAVPLRIVAREMEAGASSEIEAVLAAAMSPVRVRCPACRASMAEVRVSGLYTVDLCKRCRLLWLDAGERAQLSRESSPALDADEKAKLARSGKRDLAKWVASEQGRLASDEPPSSSWLVAVLGFLGLPVLTTGIKVSVIPLVSYALATLMTLGTWLRYDAPGIVQLLGFSRDDPLRLGGLTVLTSLMLHGSVFHWLGNLYAWLVVAPSAEQLLGSTRMLAACLIASFTACFAHLLLPGRHGVLIGASGVVSALLVFFALALPHARVSFFSWSFWLGRRWYTLPVRWALGIWLLGNVAGAVLQLSRLSHISYAAHLGGAAAGVLTYLWWRHPDH